jgi:hypothetical protein
VLYNFSNIISSARRVDARTAASLQAADTTLIPRYRNNDLGHRMARTVGRTSRAARYRSAHETIDQEFSNAKEALAMAKERLKVLKEQKKSAGRSPKRLGQEKYMPSVSIPLPSQPFGKCLARSCLLASN